MASGDIQAGPSERAPIRVLHAIHSLVAGGAEAQLCLLCSTWDDPSIEMGVFCVRPEGHTIPEGRVRIIVSPDPRPLSPGYLRGIWRAIRDFNPDVVHVWLPASVSIPVMIAARLAGKAVIFSYRSKMRFLRPLAYPEYLVALSCATKIVSNNPVEGSNHAFKWLYRWKHGEVIQNGVRAPKDVARFHPAYPAGAVWHFIFVGRLTQLKNAAAMIEAFARIGRSDWTLDVVGDGELRLDIERLIAARGLSEKILLRGFQSDVYSRLAQADVLILPSLSEGMPNALVEAFAIGIPSIAADIPGHRAIVGDEKAVVWIDPLSVTNVADTLNAVMSGAYNLPGIAAAARPIASRFSPGIMAAAYAGTYRRLFTSQR